MDLSLPREIIHAILSYLRRKCRIQVAQDLGLSREYIIHQQKHTLVANKATYKMSSESGKLQLYSIKAVHSNITKLSDKQIDQLYECCVSSHPSITRSDIRSIIREGPEKMTLHRWKYQSFESVFELTRVRKFIVQVTRNDQIPRFPKMPNLRHFKISHDSNAGYYHDFSGFAEELMTLKCNTTSIINTNLPKLYKLECSRFAVETLQYLPKLRVLTFGQLLGVLNKNILDRVHSIEGDEDPEDSDYSILRFN